MKQLLLKFQLPPGIRLFPNQFRELVAKLNLNMPEAFHRLPDGNTNTGLPPICFVGGVSWVGILAFPNNTELLYQLAGPATMAISRHLQTSVPVQLQEMDFSAEKRLTAVDYRLSEIALKRQHASTRERPVDELIRDRLLAGLARIANKYGIDLPSDNALDIDVSIRKERGLRLQVPGKMTNQFVHVVDADVQMNVDLSGMWMVGNLTSRGYGRLIKKNIGIPANKQIIGIDHV